MTDAQAPPQKLGFLASLVLVGIVAMIAAGVVWHGVALTTIQRIWQQLVERPNGPMAFRFILQPLMAAIAGFLYGRKDAQAGRSPYFWTVVINPQERLARLREGLNATAKIILLGLLMDSAYQIMELDRYFPVEAVIIAVLLGFVPYVVFRGVVTRILARFGKEPPHIAPEQGYAEWQNHHLRETRTDSTSR